MIEQTGTVTKRAAGRLYVRVEPAAGCARCEAGQGCGQGVIGQLAGRPAHLVPVQAPAAEQVSVGDVVVLGMAPRGLLVASSLVYLLPLVLMTVSAMVAGMLWPGSEALAVVFGTGGLAGGFVAARSLVRSGRLRRHLEPRFLRIAPCPANGLLT